MMTDRPGDRAVTLEMLGTPQTAGPSPVEHPDTAAFWAALRNGRFLLPSCTACGTIRFPPNPVCPTCLGAEYLLVPVETDARVTVVIEVRRATGGQEWAAAVPYLTGMVETGEGLRLPGRIFCSCGEAGRAGVAVRMCTLPAAGGHPVFGFYHACERKG